MAETPSAVSAISSQREALPACTDKSSASPRVKSNSRPGGPPLHKVYALPAPIRTVPLPSFYPNNPISLFHVVYAWLSEIISPPSAEPAVIHQGIWSPETRSVQIKDARSIRALWEQGFFGKGNYSRSEPNWLKREHVRKGEHNDHVAEDHTAQRREERKMMKWERARKEQEAVQQTRLQEAWRAPVGPMELLALPNSPQDLENAYITVSVNRVSTQDSFANGLESTSLAALETELNGISLLTDSTIVKTAVNVVAAEEGTTLASSEMSGLNLSPRPAPTVSKRRKSVRFSPKVESTIFKLSDPPSPHPMALSNGSAVNVGLANGTSSLSHPADLSLSAPVIEENDALEPSSELEIETEVDREHLQLCPEEAFYLIFAIGALLVINPATGRPFCAPDLFTLFRQTSYIPPKMTDLRPDDPFLMHYAVYHHFRSLGWVARPGVKFGVDWLLYNRGPVFSHAEFAVIVLPAYTDSWWKGRGQQPPRRSWHWLHTVNRVQSTALKTLVLAYVDIPPPFDEALSASEILTRYSVREFIVKRWLSNRNRD
ncbi:hypothetical protein GGR54DRAFT_615444 [Hypoxylon sp. NC1633]|nr:hypothetical protein GGR54DRAFT_615444 [Hypoxylon sp. NC1633]